MFSLSCVLRRSFCIALLGSITTLFGDNQTLDLSPILPVDSLPFRIVIEELDFQLVDGANSGVHSGVAAVYEGKWLLFSGRTNGLHNFLPGDDNFPIQYQNQFAFVVDPVAKTVKSRSFADPASGLSAHQVDLLSVTSPQGYQKGDTLYMTGGYGVDTATGLFDTKDALTAVDIPGLIHWVTEPYAGETASQHIRQIFNPFFKVTGGYMSKVKGHPTLLIFGQDFKGFYHDSSNGIYSHRVRRFNIIDDGVKLDVELKQSHPQNIVPAYRRRDLNVLPRMHYSNGRTRHSFVALSGVFTLTTGVWTVPVEISANGKKIEMADPASPAAFKQAMNNYVSAAFGLYSKHTKDMYQVLLGGITAGTIVNGVYVADPEIPFTNQVTTVKTDKHDVYTQYLMDAEYPVIISTVYNPGNPFLFGAGADFILNEEIATFSNGVIKLDKIKTPQVVGYVVGGIMSSLPDTNNPATDSAASPYIFKVTVIPVE